MHVTKITFNFLKVKMTNYSDIDFSEDLLLLDDPVPDSISDQDYNENPQSDDEIIPSKCKKPKVGKGNNNCIQ